MALQFASLGFMPSASPSEALQIESWAARGDSQGNSSATASIACSPPRSTHLRRPHSMTTITITPAKTFVSSKRKKRRQRRLDAGDGDGDGGSNDSGGGDGGFWGGNNGDWGSEGDDTPYFAQNLWVWQAIFLGTLVQAAHYWATKDGSEQVERRRGTLPVVTPV